ncbi:MAG: uncharacterized protein JWQ45_2299 [Blastococcus sp.]|nr:uncharacterized protein [Blastococcus sp.]
MRAPRSRAALPALLVTGLALGGCSGDTAATIVQPTCASGDDGAASNAVVLIAQSVPSATWVPCLRTPPPLGWAFNSLHARDGRAHFSLDSDRDGQQAIEVGLEKSCDTVGATEIPSDREGMRRFERVTMTTPRFEGERYYVFDGGCITFVFRLGGDNGDNRGEPLALATQAVGAVSRADLLEQVHEESDGRLELDPPTGSG